MDFMQFPPRKPRGRLIRHGVILSTAALSLFVFRLADDEITGKAQVSDASGFTLIFIIAAYYVGWLPDLWRRCKGTSFDLFLIPILSLSMIVYFYFSFRSYFIQPAATVTALFLQLLILIGLLYHAQ
jgi:hypothetical protein